MAYTRKSISIRHNWLWLLVVGLWTALIAFLLIRQLDETRQAVLDSARIVGEASYNKDLVYRRWAASHGGVYVPVTEDTPPSPYLEHIPDRDIVLPSGKKLTLMNPAYMTRQVHELEDQQSEVSGHITSLNPIRGANQPDEWERTVLQSFESGEGSVTSVERINGQPYLRSMFPMITEEACLKCHAQQGYKVGDVRGGISVSVPLQPYQDIYQKMMPAKIGHFFVIWLVGTAGILFVRAFINKQLGTIQRQLDLSQELSEKIARREKDLSISEQKYRMLFDYADHGSAVADAKTGELIACNKKLASMVGRDVDELIGQSQRILHPPGELTGKTTKGFNRHLHEDEGKTLEDQLIDKDGNLVDVEIKANRITIDGRELMHGFFYDISERKKLLEEYRRSAQLAALGTIAAGVAHEINNPIQGIMNYAALLKSSPENVDRTLEFSERIIIESDRIAQRTKALLSFARDSRKEKVLANISELVESALSLIEKKVIRHGVRIETHCPTSLPLMKVQPQGIQQIVINLIDNAAYALQGKEIPDDEKVITLSCNITDTGEGSYLCLEVADQGIGMSEETLGKAKEAFFSTKPSSIGTGLGLSIVNDIVNQHGGLLNIDSIEGEFTRVQILLPLSPRS